MKAFVGRTERAPRWKDCVLAASNKLSLAADAMYVRRHFDRSSKQVAMEMVEDLRGAFEQMLKANDWMDPDTREYALRKVREGLFLLSKICFFVLKLFFFCH
jgi:predicted metalloendopeptidase